MDNPLHALAITRQSGLRAEMNVIANNVANAGTAGFRREGVVFSEHVHAARGGGSVAMAHAGARRIDPSPGIVEHTGAPLDLAIEGEGFFLLDGAEGPLLTRAGGFQRSPEGLLVASGGRPVLDAGGGTVFLPPDARDVTVAADGTLSVDGLEQARLGVYTAAPETLERVGDTAFRPREGVEPVPGARLIQGALERSNVEPVSEIARMIAVGRAYEQMQTLIRDEDERIRESIRTLGQQA